jgi:hypothetical protein
MVSLFSMLFNDDSFDQEGSILFKWNPLFWGMGPETFSYSRTSLQKNILSEMEAEGWVGVCCEPNAIFIVCNQFPVSSISVTASQACEAESRFKRLWRLGTMMFVMVQTLSKMSWQSTKPPGLGRDSYRKMAFSQDFTSDDRRRS